MKFCTSENITLYGIIELLGSISRDGLDIPMHKLYIKPKKIVKRL